MRATSAQCGSGAPECVYVANACYDRGARALPALGITPSPLSAACRATTHIDDISHADVMITDIVQTIHSEGEAPREACLALY